MKGEYIPFNAILARFELYRVLSVCLHSVIYAPNVNVTFKKIITAVLVNESRTNLTSITKVKEKCYTADECSFCLYCEPYPLPPIHYMFTSKVGLSCTLINLSNIPHLLCSHIMSTKLR